MSVYSEKIDRILKRSGSSGYEIPDAEGADARFDCGCFVRISLCVDPDGAIRGAGHDSNGCGYMRAAAVTLCDLIVDATTSELHGLEIPDLERSIGARLGVIPSDRLACTKSACAALKAAFADLRRRRIAEFSGEQALICTCFGVSENRLQEFLRLCPDAGLDDIMDELNAGSGCGSCRPLITEIIDSIGRD